MIQHFIGNKLEQPTWDKNQKLYSLLKFNTLIKILISWANSKISVVNIGGIGEQDGAIIFLIPLFPLPLYPPFVE